MSARWNRAFGVLLCLSLTTALLSIVVVELVESTFAAAADEVSRETAAYDLLLAGVAREDRAGHTMLDRGSSSIDEFRAADQAVDTIFTKSLAAYDDAAEVALLATARAQWQDTFAMVRTIATDAATADAFAADTSSRGDDAHLDLGAKVGAILATLHQLDLISRGTLQEQLDRAHATTWRLVLLLVVIFAASVGATIVYARRMARRVVQPIRTLWESADRFGAGDLDHRVELHNDDEIGELAERFNVMADTIASTHRHLTVQAHHDSLTGLVNRAGFVGRLDAAVARAAAGDGPISVMFIDLDDFKHVNDDLGHAAGDVLLQQVAERLRGAARSTDVVCRLGGDEFAVLVGTPTGDHGVAEQLAERVLAVLEQPFSVHGALIRVGASIGIASQTSAGDDGDYLLRAADIAMYSAKGQGKHRAQLFDPAAHGPVVGDAASILVRLAAEDLDIPTTPDQAWVGRRRDQGVGDELATE